nr:glycosyltransferase [Nitrosomonas nitrosa]
MERSGVVRIFVGADRSQQLAVKVLEYSIQRHTKAPVEVIPMIDLPVPTPKDLRNSQRTGFSYSRFCIPKLAGYSGRAIYMDADMQVFKDILELWDLPFNGAKVLVQKDVKHLDVSMAKDNAPKTRIKQCAVMVLDCGRLDWDISAIVKGMDEGQYAYEQLMREMCILKEGDVGYTVPFEWNSLEYYDDNTKLIHYTDMGTQPWVSTNNPNGYIWVAEVRRMLDDGRLNWAELEDEVRREYFRPSLLREIRYGHLVPKFLCPLFNRANAVFDKARGYVPHKAVYETKRLRSKAIKAYEESLQSQSAVAD